MSRRSGKRGGGGGHVGGDERWLITYADLITLLLALFIVLFSMSTLDATRFDHLRRALAQTFNGSLLTESGQVLDGSAGVLDPMAANQMPQAQVAMNPEEITTDAQAVARSYQEQREEIEEYIEEKGLAGKADVTQDERGIVVSLAGDALFESGSAQINPGMSQALSFLARDLVRNNRHVAIEGHTDGAPISGSFRDNTELSLARAYAVFAHMRDQGVDPSRMEPSGFGEFRPVVEPASPTASEARNRRVEIVILAPASDSREGQALAAQAADAASGGRVVRPGSQPGGAPASPTTIDIIGSAATIRATPGGDGVVGAAPATGGGDFIKPIVGASGG